MRRGQVEVWNLRNSDTPLYPIRKKNSPYKGFKRLVLFTSTTMD